MGLPLGVNSGDVEGDSLEPKHHEESLGEGAVSDLGPITASLHEQFDLRLFFSHGCDGDQEAAVAGGTGRGRAGKAVSQKRFSPPDLGLALQRHTSLIRPAHSRRGLSTSPAYSTPSGSSTTRSRTRSSFFFFFFFCL